MNLAERNAMILQHQGLVERIARKVHRTVPPSVELDDLVSYGNLGLMRAVQHYDPTSNVKFETYAIAAIRGVIRDELRSIDWAPRSLRRRQREIDAAAAELERVLNRPATHEEIAAKLGIPAREVGQVLNDSVAATHRSLDERRADDVSPYEHIEDTNEADPGDSHTRTTLYEMFADLVDSFTPQEQTVVALYYFEGLTLQEVGRVLGIPESRASQIHTRAVMCVREQLVGLLAS